MSMNPPLDAARVNFSAVLLDSAARHIEHIVEDERFMESRGKATLPEGESDALDTAAQCIRWLTEEFRRSAIRLVAMDEALAGRLTGEPQVPNTPAAFAASISRPDPPEFPKAPIPVAATHDRMEIVRERLNEACSVLAKGQGNLTNAALERVQFLHFWCSGSASQCSEEDSPSP
ncbi:hypothetical protein [Mycobacteroides chelonae]|uniref:hypothetical protein n=1 Tax=Mycobacteroides chelonae TaxID=1774 RepID=UPI0038760986